MLSFGNVSVYGFYQTQKIFGYGPIDGSLPHVFRRIGIRQELAANIHA